MDKNNSQCKLMVKWYDLHLTSLDHYLITLSLYTWFKRNKAVSSERLQINNYDLTNGVINIICKVKLQGYPTLSV